MLQQQPIGFGVPQGISGLMQTNQLLTAHDLYTAELYDRHNSQNNLLDLSGLSNRHVSLRIFYYNKQQIQLPHQSQIGLGFSITFCSQNDLVIFDKKN